ncbi:hypothetical protein ASO20_01370 [Mycoplasma sp. (ex Biomphalaria glabrata)]|uniref:FoF1 ATP synthase subunit A n=1 Tax=Mycoplasma sp. (ex Biomphalaria glabrata) TaxID=1749074 RepID=UPI00073A950A|nr:FoF1 ATP synthase subunit a [Mycoplasma sp. (ex Biomphalaria glabrata)]ALV23301.1 hypothetical protein ASO20_01370 [Mycoplasma sp. (ex Biomphalaria glabrata)]
MTNFLQSISVLQPQLLTLIITTIIILTAAWKYKSNLAKLEPNQAPSGFTLLMENFTSSMEKTVIEVMGTRFRWFTPYAIYLVLYLGIGNVITLLGFDSIATNYTIIFSLGIVTFVGIYVCGIRFQKLGFITKFIKNPLDLLTQFAPLISITFRIFGNLTAGATILSLFYAMTQNAGIRINSNWAINTYNNFINNTDSKNPYDTDLTINILGGLLAPPLHFYFDIFDGLIQSYIFMILTLSYIGQEAEHHDSEKSEHKRRFNLIKRKSSEIIDESVDVVRKI